MKYSSRNHQGSVFVNGHSDKVQKYAHSLGTQSAFCGYAVLLVLLIVLASPADGQDHQMATKWKAHFKSTPVIENCVFERKIYSGNGETNLYQFKCQENAFLFRQIRTLEDVYSNNIPVKSDYEGHFGSNSWSIGSTADNYGILKLYPNTNDIWRKLPQNGDFFMLYAAERQLFSALYYGIKDLDPKTVEWLNEFRFSARSVLGQKFLGEITSFDKGLPIVLEWRVEDAPDPQFRFVIEYKYEENSNWDLPYYPSEIQIFSKENGKKELKAEYKILMLKSSANPLEQNLFDPHRYFVKPPTAKTPRISMLVFSNDTIYDVSSGHPEKVLPSSKMESFVNGEATHENVKLIRWCILSFLAASLIVVLIILKRTNTNNKSNERKNQ